MLSNTHQIILSIILFLSVFLGFAYSSPETLALLEQLELQRSDLTPYGLRHAQTLDLNLGLGLGFHCGRFDPALSIKNTLNQFEKGVQNVANSVLSQATAAIISLPMYKLAQSNPKLYNLLNHNFITAQQQFGIAMKSCHQMESEALKGDNPYLNWAQVSRQNLMAKVQNQNGEQDLQAALNQVNQVEGDKGVPWVHKPGEPTQFAGGINQKPIWIIRDLTELGFDSLYQEQFKEPKLFWTQGSEAADWVVSVVGDQMVTTCEGCLKGSKTPRGLYYAIDQSRNKILLELSQSLEQFSRGNFTDHAFEEEPYYNMTPRLIEAIRHFDLNNQYKILEALSEQRAVRKTLHQAFMAKRLLKAGSYFPEAIAIPDVQKQVNLALSFLDSEILDLMRSFEIKNRLLSQPMQYLFHLDQSLMEGVNLPMLRETKVGSEKL